MSIANELSSEVAAALLSRQEDGSFVDSSKLVKTIVEVHSTLRHLTIEARRNTRRAQTHANQPQAGSAANASGNPC
jgi:non-ribosomal peptide synthetase component E (peptide arylation enzyme)